MSLGIAEAFNLGSDFFNQNNKKETDDDGGGEEDNTSSNSSSGDNKKVGDYYQSGTGKSKRYYVLEEDGGFRKTNFFPDQVKNIRKDFNVVVEELKGNNQQQPPPGKKVEDNKISFLPINMEEIIILPTCMVISHLLLLIIRSISPMTCKIPT